MPCSTHACAPQAASFSAADLHAPLASRHVQTARQSLAVVAAESTWAPSLVTHVVSSLAVPQYRRTFVQGCACSTGFAGGGCCPSSVSGLALQTGCGAHGPVGLMGGVLAALGVYGGTRVIINSLDAQAQIRRVAEHLAPQIERRALLEVQASAADLPRARLTQELRALGLWSQALKTSAAEQRFNIWVPGVLQTLAATGAMVLAAQHVGFALMGPAVGACVGVVAPALFAAYAALLMVKHVYELHRAPKLQQALYPTPSDNAAAHALQNRLHAYTQARRTDLGRTALAWGAVGTIGAIATLAAARVVFVPVTPAAWLALSMAAAGFAMWQNSQTRYVPHLPVSPHVAPQALSTQPLRQQALVDLNAQDDAIKDAVARLYAEAPTITRAAHQFERLFRPQCGPSANQTLARFVHDQIKRHNVMLAARQARIVMQAAGRWLTEEIDLVQAVLGQAHSSIRADVEALERRLDPSCKHTAARLQQTLLQHGPLAHTLAQTAQYVRDEAQALEGAQLRLMALKHCQTYLQALYQEDMKHVVGPDADAEIEGPAKTWLWVRLSLLLLSGTLGDAIDKDIIVTHKALFSQLASPDALPIHNVYVLPAHIEAFAAVVAPHIDGGFVHAFLNPRRIEAEIDYVLELETLAQATPQSGASAAPECTGETCCR